VIPILGFLGVQFPEALTQSFSYLSPGRLATADSESGKTV